MLQLTLSVRSIPGFQVFDISTGRIKRYGKEYGKKLNDTTVRDGIDLMLFCYLIVTSNIQRLSFPSIKNIFKFRERYVVSSVINATLNWFMESA